ncbi:unnamed protein product [Musa acuminata subsp. burmannicoides]
MEITGSCASAIALSLAEFIKAFSLSAKIYADFIEVQINFSCDSKLFLRLLLVSLIVILTMSTGTV